MSKSTLSRGKTSGVAKGASATRNSAKTTPAGNAARSTPKTTKQTEAVGGKVAPKQTATPRSGSARSSFQERQEQRRLKRYRLAQVEQRWRLFKRFSLFGGGALVIALVIYLIVNAYHPNTTPPSAHNLITGTGTYTTPADGSARDGMSCLGMEGAVVHIHMYLAIYVNGKQVQVPPDTGIVNGGTCFYPLHVHSDPGDENIIHEESPVNATYTLGAFSDVWGQRLSSTQVMSYKADATHTLTFITFDGNGHETVVKGNPLNITFSEHETIYILYNSPNVTPTPFTNFLPGE